MATCAKDRWYMIIMHVPEQLGLVYVDYSLLSNSMECLNMYVVNSFISKKSCLMLPNYHTPGEV